MGRFVLYLFTFCASFACTRAALPLLARTCALRLVDKPGGLKTHAHDVPVLGGCGIFAGLCATLILIRICTQFPTGTLHSLRGIILGGALIFVMGLCDDLRKPQGLSVWTKLLLQMAATACLIYYGIVIRVFPSPWLAYPLTFLWVVGLTNAFNLLDIVDGLCTSQAIVCTLGLALIALPSEFIYVNFAALSLLGACVAFLPFNFSRTHKLFLGDSGSNLLGFLIAALCLGTGYSHLSNWGFLAPLLIVFVPIADISFVTLARLMQGKNPLKGSNDHAALRLRARGWTDKRLVCTFALGALIGNLLAFIVTFCPPACTAIILLGVILAALVLGYRLFRTGGPHAR
ncbi:MraY family glycosyltransferase [Candidatus Avelusimicrobium caledoniensis]|uniref:MraY family glycosyltransferase n=1 Tax=Candidatus Avelusimicrobium caledoniensis TaxID=3416220 RepID=UPI003D0994EC